MKGRYNEEGRVGRCGGDFGLCLGRGARDDAAQVLREFSAPIDTADDDQAGARAWAHVHLVQA